MIIGQGPGNAELAGVRAFAGQSGRTLEGWLVSCGANPKSPRDGIYFTSVIKCVCPSDKYFAQMAGNCRQFLRRQIMELAPELVITLGKKAYEELRVDDGTYEEGLCAPHHTSQLVLITPFGLHFNLLHWPHPSGLNRWHNESANASRLKASFDFVRQFIGSAA